VEGDLSHNFNIQLQHPGDFIGISSLFHQNTYSYSTVALTPTVAILIEKDTLQSVMKQNGGFAYGIISKYCRQDVLLYDIISRMMYKQMNGRIADSLLYLSSEVFAGEEVFIHLSRKDIAEFAGISTESAVKLLKSFEKDNLIRLEEKNIIILNRVALKEISKNG
jgi:CRP/FNR family transcriptional regulator